MKHFKLLIILFLFSFNLSAHEMRAAIDLGSGAVKIQMGMVDTEANRLVGQPQLTRLVHLGLTENVARHEGRISEEMERKVLEILIGLKKEAIESSNGHPVQFTGIATAVFRKATNGSEVLQKIESVIGLRFQILSQDEEGKLGFLTAKALYPGERDLLAWDSGNGSFQMTVLEDDSYKVYQGPLGHGSVRVLLSKDIRNGVVLQGHESGNPVLKKEAIKLNQKIKDLLPSNPDWLVAKLSANKIVTFGDGESIFALVAQAVSSLNGDKEPVQQATIWIADVQRVIDTYLEQDDEVFNEAGLHRKTLTSAVHLAAIMQHFDIQRIYFKRSLGNTPGMLIAPDLWRK